MTHQSSLLGSTRKLKISNQSDLAVLGRVPFLFLLFTSQCKRSGEVPGPKTCGLDAHDRRKIGHSGLKACPLSKSHMKNAASEWGQGYGMERGNEVRVCPQNTDLTEPTQKLSVCKGWPGAASSQQNSSIHVGLAAVGSETV